MDSSRFLIIGAKGQLGTALKAKFPTALAVDVEELDITSQTAVENFNWNGVEVILNAAAYTNVDGAETAKGKIIAKQVNADAVGYLAGVAKKRGMVFVHISTDYVFDGSKSPHKEDEPFSPLNTYGLTKAEGDKHAATVPKHYIIRTSWVIGEGKNFVRTMLELGKKGISPSIVNDQVGRLTFTSELVRVVDFLLNNNAPYGTYNLSDSGQPASWADITKEIFSIAKLPNTVIGISTEEYYKDKPGSAKRPLNSTLDLAKIESMGFKPTDWQEDLAKYIESELRK